MKNNSKIVFSLDKIGIILTTTCLIHCIVVPLILPFLSLVGLSFFASEKFENYFIIGTLILASLSLVLGYVKHHKKWYPLITLFMAAVICLFAHESADQQMKHVIISIGALLIISSHFLNLRLCKSCESKSCSHHK